MLDALASLLFLYYKKLTAPPTAVAQADRYSQRQQLGREKERPAGGTRSPPPELDRPDLRAAQVRSTPLSTTSHRTRLPLPQEVREPSTRSRRETASFHRLSAVARHRHRASRTRSSSHLQHGFPAPTRSSQHLHQTASPLWLHHRSPRRCPPRLRRKWPLPPTSCRAAWTSRCRRPPSPSRSSRSTPRPWNNKGPSLHRHLPRTWSFWSLVFFLPALLGCA